MTRKKFIIVLITSTILTLSYVAFLFTPYFYEINSNTGAIIKEVYGYQIAFGRNGPSDVHIIGNGFMVVGQIAGMVAGVCSLIYTLWYIFFKKDMPIMMFLYCLCTPCLALAFTSIAIAWPMYQVLNSSTLCSAYYKWCYYVTIVLTALALIIDALALVYVTIHRKKGK